MPGITEPTPAEIIEAGTATNWHYTNTCLALGYLKRTMRVRQILDENDLEWSAFALDFMEDRQHIGPLAKTRKRKPSLNKRHSIPAVIKAAERSNWHYERCCIELGYKTRTNALGRLLARHGTTWIELAHSQGAMTAKQTVRMIGPQSPEELAECARHFDWNQSAVARHVGLKSVKAGFHRRVIKWGYAGWVDFCIKHGRERPVLTLELILEAAEDVGWDLQRAASALHYTNHGGILSHLTRHHGLSNWSALKSKYAPKEYHDRPPLTMERLLDACNKCEWDTYDIARMLGYLDMGAPRHWLKRRGYKGWSDFQAIHDDQVDSRPARRRHPIAKIAADNGWHIDLTAWAMDTDRANILRQLRAEGFKNWHTFFLKNKA